jgi:hypothetical protein
MQDVMDPSQFLPEELWQEYREFLIVWCNTVLCLPEPGAGKCVGYETTGFKEEEDRIVPAV